MEARAEDPSSTAGCGGRWLWAAALGVLLMACLPELVGYARHGEAFLGVPNGVDVLDNLYYVERARAWAPGPFRVPNLHTADPGSLNPQALPLPWLVGAAFAACGLPPGLYPLVTKLLFGALMLGFLACLARRLFAPSEFRVGLAHLWLAAGFFWTLDLPSLFREGSQASYLERLPMLQPESSSFFALYFHAHLALSLTLLCGCFWCVFLTERPRPWLAAALSFVLASIHPYDLLTLATVGAVQLVVLFARERKRFAGCFLALSAAGAGALGPVVVHYLASYRTFVHNKVDDYWLQPFDFFFGFGQPLLLGLYFLWASRQEPGGGEAVPGPARTPSDTSLWVSWLLVAPFLVSNPAFFFRRKLALGLSVPLAVLGARGALVLGRRLGGSRPALTRTIVGVLTCAACLTSFDVVARDIATVATGRFPPVLPPDVTAVVRSLASRPEAGTVLAQPDYLSQLLPGLTGRRVFRGWTIYVTDLEAKSAALQAFLAPGTSLEARRAFLERHEIAELVLPAELSGPLGADRWPFLVEEGRFGQFTLYRFVR